MFTTAVCDIQLTRLNATIIKNTNYPEKGYALLPDRDIVSQSWDKIAVDFIGPWEVKVMNRLVTFNALTVIDTMTNLVKITCVDNKTCAHATNKLRQCWLSRYPRPQRIVHDGSG